MSDGSITINTELDNKKAYQEIDRLKRKIQSLEDQLYTKKQQRLPLIEDAKCLGAELDAAKAKLNYMQSGEKFFTSAHVEEQAETVKRLQKDWDGVQKKVEQYDASIEKTSIEIGRTKDRAGAIEQHLAKGGVNSEKMAAAMDRAQKSANRFVLRLREVVRSALVFTLITQSLAAFRDWMGKVIKTNDEATAAMARLKGALLTLAQPLLNVIIPAFTTFVNILADLVGFIARILSALFGTTAEESANAAENLYDEANAIKGVGAAAKKAERSLAGFDEINKITSENASGGRTSNDKLLPDFTAIKALPDVLKNLAADIEMKIKSLSFSWDKGDFADKDIWIVALSGILGAVIGAMFGGVSGTAIGLILGLSIGVVACTFFDKTSNPEMYKGIFIVVLSSILGAILGTMFGGLPGGAIGLLLGATISIISLEFAKGEESTWDPQNTIIVVLSAILGAILGSVFGGLPGGAIGLLLGASISFIAIEFNEGKFNKSEAIASLRIAIFAVLGAILGTMFGGFGGTIFGLILGATIGFGSVAFDEKLDAKVRSAASKALKIALSTIICALVGAVFGAGVFGAIIGGAIGLTFGVAVTLGSASIKDKTGLSGTSRGSGFNGRSAQTASARTPAITPQSIPALASGAVIPPNRAFMAVLGDQGHGNNLEAPEGLIRKIVREEAGGGGATAALLQSILEAVRAGKVLVVDKKVLARVTAQGINDMTRAAGKSVLLI